MQSSNRGADPARRLWLTTATITGSAGLVAAAVPFVESFEPSERARAIGAPVSVELGGVRPGELQTVEWRGKPVWILRRTPMMLQSLERDMELLADPNSQRSEQPPWARNRWRSLRPEIAVLVGICTHLGCIPTFRPQPGAADLGNQWPGGFFCPCHGSKFDLAGRVFRNVPAPTNLVVPMYRYESDSRMIVGDAK